VTIGTAVVFSAIFLSGCGGSSATSSNIGSGGTGGYTAPPAATPTVATTPAQNGAVLATLATTTSGASIFYTLDGSTPTSSSPQYFTPFLIASNLTLKAVATAAGYSASDAMSQSYTPNIPPGTLIWSDEFTNSTGAIAQPNPLVWTYDTGLGSICCGNQELEIYCAWASTASSCDPANPNAFVGTDGALHIVAESPSASVYTSGRLKSQGLFSFQYGRVEVRAQLPEAQGLWPAFWLLGNNITAINWPACGEMDVLERINAALTPDWNQGSIHMNGGGMGTPYYFPSGQTAAGWHTYGMIWSPGSVAYYVDNPAQPYVTYTPSSLSGLSGAVWPFDSGANFIILNLAVGGDWPGSPDATTPFPSTMLVDYVRVYTN
jgi:beta-glucanase (GH16 family)